MEWAGVAQALLAVVFTVSGVAKAVDPAGTREAVTAFGVPPRLVPAVALGLPVAELAAVGALLLAPDAGLAAVLALLTAFTVAVLRLLARGERPTCRCFGRLGSSDVSWRTVARNAALAGAAVAALAAGAGSYGVVEVALGAAAAALLLLTEVLGARRQEARDLAALEESLEGTTALPDFAAPDLQGEVHGPDQLLDGRPLLLVFLSTGCGTCVRMAPSVARWAQVHADRLRVVVVSSGTAERSRELFGGAPGLTVLLDDGAVREAFAVDGSPGAVLVSAGRRVVGDPAGGLLGVQRLLQAGLDLPEPLDPERIDAAFVPAPAPSVHAASDEGRTTLRETFTGAVVELDQLGSLVWSVLDGRSTLHEIAVDLADVFEAPLELVEADVVRLARSLGAQGMLDGVRPEVPDSAHAG